MQGQIRIDFIFGVVAFSMVIFFLSSQINFIWTNIETNSRLDTAKLTATSLLTYLAEDSGDPANWETLPKEQIKRIGLAEEPYKLSIAKINRLNSECGLLDNRTLGGFRISIYNSVGQVLKCGFVGEQLGSKVFRTLLVENDYGNMTVEVW